MGREREKDSQKITPKKRAQELWTAKRREENKRFLRTINISKAKALTKKVGDLIESWNEEKEGLTEEFFGIDKVRKCLREFNMERWQEGNIIRTFIPSPLLLGFYELRDGYKRLEEEEKERCRSYKKRIKSLSGLIGQ